MIVDKTRGNFYIRNVGSKDLPILMYVETPERIVYLKKIYKKLGLEWKPKLGY
jgi:hypothetical protein